MELGFSLFLYSGECPGEGEVMNQKNLGMGAFSTFFWQLGCVITGDRGWREPVSLSQEMGRQTKSRPELPNTRPCQPHKIHRKKTVWDNGPGKQKLIVAFCCCFSTIQNPEQEEYTQNTVHGAMSKNTSESLPLTPTCLTSPCSYKFLPSVKWQQNQKRKELKV